MTTAEMLIGKRTSNPSNRMTLRAAALVAGIGLLIMVIAAPFAELYAYPKLVVPGDASETVRNILANQMLFTLCILAFLTTYICDVLVAWALYILLKPVNENLSRLTAWFRLIYTVIAVVALLDLVTVQRILNHPDTLNLFQPEQLEAQVMLALITFRSHWYFGLLFFGIHLGLLGYLVLRSTYIPGFLGILLVLAGAGYMVTTLKPLFPDLDFNLDVARFTFYGELIFMLWLLIKGPRIPELD